MLLGELELIGRIQHASNASFLAEIEGTHVIYKPVAGERPLWDFPDAVLAHREYATYLVSEALDLGIVPPTVLRPDGPHGAGMVQLWQHDVSEDAVQVVAPDAIPEGWKTVLHARDEDYRPVVLIHEDTPALRRMALFDLVINNADRKGGHVLCFADGRRQGIDHGLTFHTEEKVRTVLWGWMGEPLSDAELDLLAGLARSLVGQLGQDLRSYLNPMEIEALRERVGELGEVGHFPPPHAGMPPIPWPPF